LKGIAHFAVGVAAASCFPEAVRAGAAGNPAYFVLGGACGLLPDTMDFKFGRFLHRHEVEVVPDPLKFDTAAVAAAVAGAVNRAAETGRSVDIKLNTVQLGADRWRQYTVRFDGAARRVRVRPGPVVDGGGNRLPGERERGARPSEAPLACGVRLEYMADTTIGAFDGPVFRMRPEGDGTVAVEFMPWRRGWTHSLVTCLLAGLALAAVWRPLAGIVAALAGAAHVGADQLGYLGSSLLYPFRRRRTEGLKRMHSGETLPNLAAVWGSCVVIWWNIYRATPGAPPLHPLRLLFYAMVLPGLLLAGWKRVRQRRSA